MISVALNPSAVADFHLASFVITQMWGSVLRGQLTQSFHWIFLNPPLKLADPMLARLDARRDLYSPRGCGAAVAGCSTLHDTVQM